MTQLDLLNKQPLTDKESIIYELVRRNPRITTYEIQDYCRDNRVTNCADRYIRWCQQKGYIEGERFKGNQKRWRAV